MDGDIDVVFNVKTQTFWRPGPIDDPHRRDDSVSPLRPVAVLAALTLLAGCAGQPAGATDGEALGSEPSATAPASESASPSPSHGASPKQSAFPSGEAVGDPIGPPDFNAGDWVMTTVDGLNMREEADTNGALIGKLHSGAEGTIVEGPIEADGHEWVYLAWPGLPAGSGCATGPDEDGFLSFCGASGWVATADSLGNPWVERTDPDCPSREPTTVQAFVQIPPGKRLACLGGEELVFDGYFAPEAQGRGCYPGYSVAPEWLGPCPIVFLQGVESQFDGTESEISVNVEGDLGACDFGGTHPASCPFAGYVGEWVRITGMVDHPTAETCTSEPWEGNEFGPSPALTVYQCRERFVVTGIAPGTAP
jgi:hypothetical protein